MNNGQGVPQIATSEDNAINKKHIEKHVLFRFSLYGFLKNQRYFAPFILLAFLEKGLPFFQIGVLFGFRELCINLFEIPSGALADLHGRKKTMILSFFSYTVSFVLFALSAHYLHLFFAILFFSIGEAFRAGTHKAMVIAPVPGLAVDHVGMWSVALLGFWISLVFWSRIRLSPDVAR
ncbi:MAG: hypothetical protein JXM79_01950 [Sedimentisphaerales bacterium]|nr:hypothetical protein [Sedimentisphaerales bacterium]